MGRKGIIFSAAAGGSLIAASLVLVMAVATVVGFRGFHGAQDLPARQSAVLGSVDREAGAADRAAPAVIGGSRQAARRTRSSTDRRRARARSSAPRRPARTRAATAPRSRRLGAPARKRPAQSATAPPAEAPVAAPPAEEPQPAPSTTAPVQELLDNLGGTVEKPVKRVETAVGDVLLDLRDALP